MDSGELTNNDKRRRIDKCQKGERLLTVGVGGAEMGAKQTESPVLLL